MNVLSRDWLLTDTPASQSQAAWGRRYRLWRDFRAHPLAMAGLIVVAILVLAAAIITGLRLARDPRAGCKTERVIDAVEDGIFLANQIYEKALLRFGQGNTDFKW